MSSAVPMNEAEPIKRAVAYLRVSTPKQMETAIDIDPDGNSIATQREDCRRKATQLHAEIVQEFIEPGNSAQTIAKRPVFRELMRYVAEHPEIDVVIVYMRSRAFRNLGDAVVTKRQLEGFGVRLVSAKEDFGEGYMADAMEAVTDIFNEIEVRRNGEDIRVKLKHKAMGGGTIGRAKLGYLNTRTDIGGRLVNTVGLDPERAPLVLQAWELYATGEYSLEALSETMADEGLTTRPSARWPSQAVSVNKLAQMLRDPYYTGLMVYKGEIVGEGRHDAIITPALFDRVQEIMDSRQQRGTRSRVHHHYLKGMLFCDRCHAQGRTSRLIYTEARGRGGDLFEYYKCRGRQQGFCDLPHVPVWLIEQAVEGAYASLGITDDFATEVRDLLAETLADSERVVRDSNANLKKQLSRLDVKEERLLDLAEDSELPTDKLKERLRTIQLDRARIRGALKSTSAQLALGSAVLESALDLVREPETLYLAAPENVRRTLNQTFYDGFYVDDEPTSVRPVLKPPFDDLHQAAGVAYLQRHADQRSKRLETPNGRPVAGAPVRIQTRVLNLADAFTVKGWSKPVLVGATGIEPVAARIGRYCL